MGGLVEEELEREAGDVLGVLVQKGGDDFPSDEAAAGDDAGLCTVGWMDGKEEVSMWVGVPTMGAWDIGGERWRREMKTYCMDTRTLCDCDEMRVR